MEFRKRFNMITTFKGKQVDVFNFKKEDFDIDDVAHSLARICRYNGHCTPFYSVAQHSLNVYRMSLNLKANAPTKLYALIHDATECYVGDIPGPVKKKMPEFQKIEAGVQAGINDFFNHQLGVKDWTKEVDMDLVHKVDKSMLLPEMSNLFKDMIIEFDFGAFYNLPASHLKLATTGMVDDTTLFKNTYHSVVLEVQKYFADRKPQDVQVDI